MLVSKEFQEWAGVGVGAVDKTRYCAKAFDDKNQTQLLSGNPSV